MVKRGKSQKSGGRNPKKMKRDEKNIVGDDMDDEVDLFHKQRDIIPLDMDEDSDESDDELAVLDYKGAGEDDSDDEGDSDEEDDDDDDDDESDVDDKEYAKLSRTQKYLKAKHGDLEDEFLGDADDTEQKRATWGRAKSIYHNADNVDYEVQSSDDGSADEEEKEVIRLRKDSAKLMTMADFVNDDDEQDGSDAEPTLEEIMVKQKDALVSSKTKETEDNLGVNYEEVKKDLSSLSRDEQMDVVSSSAPELVGLLSELNDSLKQLDQINPLVSKLKVKKETTKKEELNYLEVKKLLLLSYSQAITFYLLLKSEGQPVRDHPVISRLVEIKSLLDKTKMLDENLPSQLDVLLDENEIDVAMPSAEKVITTSNEPDSDPNEQEQPVAVELKAPKSRKVEKLKRELQNVKGLENKNKRHEESISSQSVKMLSVRAALEEKLKQKGVFTTLEPNNQRTQKQKLRPHNSQLETIDDFGDVPLDTEGKDAHDLSKKVSKLVSAKGNNNKVSGDDDLPQRDDLGERRRKHQLQVLAGAGVNRTDDSDAEDEPTDGENVDESEDELNNLEATQITAKNSKTVEIPLEPDTTVDGKRLITQLMEKNRGLTPHRKKLTKNPRKKYKLKHQKAKKNLGGQVRQVRKPEGPYGGESTGINAGVSRSIRFRG